MTKSPPISFHVRHNVWPERLLEALRRISLHEVLDGIVESDRQVTRAISLGLVRSGDEEQGNLLTPTGVVFLKLVGKRAAHLGELGHYLHYAVWTEAEPDRNGFGYLYRAFCDYLYENRSFELALNQSKTRHASAGARAETTESPRDGMQRLCVQLSNSIEEAPIFQGRLDKSISLSPDSLTGVLKWLEALQPPVIENGLFARRSFCSPELLLLAIGFALRDEPEAVGVDILLSHARREEICRVCLLDPAAFDQTLDWMIPIFPQVIVSSEEAGYYGRYIRLLKRPELEDLVR